MRNFGRRDEEAELFFSELMGATARPRATTMPRGQTPRRWPAPPAAGTGAEYARLFDEAVHRGAGTVGRLDGASGEVWQVVARPGAPVPAAGFDAGELVVVRRALGDGRMAVARTLNGESEAESVAPLAFPRAGGRLPRDTIVLRRVREADAAEDLPRPGRGSFRYEPLGGDPGDNVEARFNVGASTSLGANIDIVVYLHGFGRPGPRFLADKADRAGLDMVNTAGTVTRRMRRPTLALVPRGRYEDDNVWKFQRVLPHAAALYALVDAGLAWLARSVLGLAAPATFARGPQTRLTMMAHSGGGAGLSNLLANGLNPDEVICFDSMYGGEAPIAAWAAARIGSSERAHSSGLRTFYTGCEAPSAEAPGGRWVTDRRGQLTYQPPGSWRYWDHSWHLVSTEVSARRLQHAIDVAVAGVAGGAALASRYKVERPIRVAHDDIPSHFAPALLDDIAATLTDVSAPPPETSPPVCVAANSEWLRTDRYPVKPGDNGPPPTRPTVAAAPAEAVAGWPSPTVEDEPPAEDLYTGTRAYTPSADATLFRAPPTPVPVANASQWPTSTQDPDAAARRALAAAGATAATVGAYAGAGLDALRPIAALFGEAALIELLARLRYTPAALAAPPHSHGSAAALAAAFGRSVPGPVLLATRLLLAIPGHFRQLARRADTDGEAYAVETLGWLLMSSLRDEVATATSLRFWLPDPPAFVAPFPNPLPAALGAQVTSFVVRRGLIDTTLGIGDFNGRLAAWRSGAPGRAWQLETGRTVASGGRPPGAPFYADGFTVPALINTAAERAQVQAAWAGRVAAFNGGRNSVPLTQCDDTFITPLRLFGPISLRGLQLRMEFPSPVARPTLRSLTGLRAAAPAFEAAFQAIYDLGWNDLLFETQGMGCFRGKKIPGNPAAAEQMSEHSLGIAVDVNAFENGQNLAGAMDPRIVALFEGFRFRWGGGFATRDPMHFEYT
jgi:hypothetical protein